MKTLSLRNGIQNSSARALRAGPHLRHSENDGSMWRVLQTRPLPALAAQKPIVSSR
jgi:hypothetical protein